MNNLYTATIIQIGQHWYRAELRVEGELLSSEAETPDSALMWLGIKWTEHIAKPKGRPGMKT